MYVAHFTIHGLVRGSSLEMGRDSDTGGQVQYVIELAKALICNESVRKVDIFTRKIVDPEVSPDYASEVEPICDGLNIVRIPCGPHRYLRKELLWPHLPEFVDNVVKYFKSSEVPDILHSHYADAGFVGMALADLFSRPLIHTGHSLGRSKKARLMAGGMSAAQIDKRYRMEHRISVEEDLLNKADLIIASTQQEIVEQYGLYEAAEAGNFEVLPPGIDTTVFHPYYQQEDDATVQIQHSLREQLARFWRDPRKPFILTICRPDPKKNIGALIEAYAGDEELKRLANLAVFAGVRDDISELAGVERQVLTDLLLLLDKHDLYGKLALPKHHDFGRDVPELYRLAAEAGGVFVNPALVEPFGLTLIEASSVGLPIVATNQGGPVEIVQRLQNGYLVNADSRAEVAEALRVLLRDGKVWNTFSENGIRGVRENYTWQSHVDRYVGVLPALRRGEHASQVVSDFSIGTRLQSLSRLLIVEIDSTLVGSESDLRRLLEKLSNRKASTGFGVVTGRSKSLTVALLNRLGIPLPDVMFCSVGTEVYYGETCLKDIGWQQYLRYRWNRERIVRCLQELPFLEFQADEHQTELKVSFNVTSISDASLDNDTNFADFISQRLKEQRIVAQVRFSHGVYLDILPIRSDQVRAIRYVGDKWGIPRDRIVVAGDSNSQTMLQMCSKAIMVPGSAEESSLPGAAANLFLATQPHAAGVLEGLEQFLFWE
jgi:sucrose-phosphate synthase